MDDLSRFRRLNSECPDYGVRGGTNLSVGDRGVHGLDPITIREVTGLATGVLSGLFGVGGGFVIVLAL